MNCDKFHEFWPIPENQYTKKTLLRAHSPKLILAKNICETLALLTFKCQPQKMVKHTQTIHRYVLFELDHCEGLALKGSSTY